MIGKNTVFIKRLKESKLGDDSHRPPGSEFQIAEAATENARRLPITLNGEQMAPGRAEMASSGEVSDRCTAIHRVLRCLMTMNTPVDHGRDRVTDTIGNVQPVELSE